VLIARSALAKKILDIGGIPGEFPGEEPQKTHIFTGREGFAPAIELAVTFVPIEGAAGEASPDVIVSDLVCRLVLDLLYL
jgi:hypothetical protein